MIKHFALSILGIYLEIAQLSPINSTVVFCGKKDI